MSNKIQMPSQLEIEKEINDLQTLKSLGIITNGEFNKSMKIINNIKMLGGLLK